MRLSIKLPVRNGAMAEIRRLSQAQLLVCDFTGQGIVVVAKQVRSTGGALTPEPRKARFLPQAKMAPKKIIIFTAAKAGEERRGWR